MDNTNHNTNNTKPKLNILAIIPARGGSKGLPGKNVKLLCGKSLIGHAIDEAKKSEYITRVILSTDDEEIARVGQTHNVEIPFMRPAHLATDTALAVDNYIYTIQRLEKDEGYITNVFVILQPTSPLRTVEDIDATIKIFLDNKADSAISVVEYEHPIERARIITENGTIQNYNQGKIVMKNRADYGKVYSPNGCVYVLTPKLLIEQKTYYFENTYPYIMPKYKSIDIDYQDDFDVAQFWMKRRDASKQN